jgi:cobalamin biosynthesis Co2+ chelatase CbiK
MKQLVQAFNQLEIQQPQYNDKQLYQEILHEINNQIVKYGQYRSVNLGTSGNAYTQYRQVMLDIQNGNFNFNQPLQNQDFPNMRHFVTQSVAALPPYNDKEQKN